MRAVAPNAITALALCFGLTAIRYAIGGEWERAVAFIMAAGVLDGIDGRIARLLRGESRFGAELDSLADAIDFGVSPAIVVYLWSLQTSPRLGWICALVYAVFCALRLARFNAQIDTSEQPHKSAGFLTGIPAPAGAGLAMLPLYLWFITGEPVLRSPWLVGPWLALIAVLMVSSVATYSWSSLKLRRNIRFEAIVVAVAICAALISAPWQTLSVVCVLYLLTLPFSARSYMRIRRQRAAATAPTNAAP
ncbi:phosphatidylcholine/phosphatidylserine synthase [Sphingomonas donggukensis]|uniref:Phosphatidylcholine/phosphatidylserine synthase n=1 Tax=Sphingomonas donggukensis TaxID=2949093 RepID=A0ABY4U212_9SPHN|nr:phosphatidylcholine/phosphatidylserine synthase [Sphingomonas donggukensis]URW76588.1 phosphatidylcholine/phosphatidylserine synthase [Sphingomonas donggukensis]